MMRIKCDETLYQNVSKVSFGVICFLPPETTKAVKQILLDFDNIESSWQSC